MTFALHVSLLQRLEGRDMAAPHPPASLSASLGTKAFLPSLYVLGFNSYGPTTSLALVVPGMTTPIALLLRSSRFVLPSRLLRP